jgi:hypothetical protein
MILAKVAWKRVPLAEADGAFDPGTLRRGNLAFLSEEFSTKKIQIISQRRPRKCNKWDEIANSILRNLY